MADFWNSFCRDSKCSNPKSRACSPGLQLLTYPYYSCIYHALIILYGLLLIAMILFSVTRKRPLRKCVHDPAYHQCLSHIKKASAVINICVGVGYLGIGSWVLSGKLNSSKVSKSTHWWVLFFSQGSTWLIIGLSCIFHRIFQSRLLQIVSISTFLYGVISFFLSLHTVMAAKYMSVSQVLDILSIVGATLVLLTGTLNVDKGEEAGKDPDKSTLNLPCLDQFAAQVTPFSSAGFISKLSFWWLQPLMKKGSEKTLEEADIPELRDQDKAESCYLQFLDQMGIIKQRRKSTKFSILWTILLCHWKPLVLSSFFAFVKVLAISAGPLLLKSFIAAAKGEKGFKYQGYILIILLFISKSLEAVAQRQWYFWSRLIGVKVKSLLIAIIYKKQLRLSSTARITNSAGEIVNYINVDAQKVGEFPPCFHRIWTALLQLCIALMILFREVRLAAITSLIMIVLIAMCSIPLGKLQNKFQNRLMVAQDARLKSSTEALTNMKILKLYAWEKHFKNAIESLRKIECKWLLSLQLQKAYSAILFWASPMLVSGATFASCYFLKVPLHTSNVFTFVSALCLVQDMMSSIPELLGAVIEARVAFIRILMFLEAPELQELESCEEKGDMKVQNCAVLVKSADMCWNESPVEPTLRNIDLELKPGEKMALCGKVGAGKSTLLAGIMGELPYIHGGTVDVLGKIAYVSQASWIQAGTIRKNILFGSAMDDQKYQKTLEICSLLKDLELLPNGDMTEIGDRGITLSGGQKQRIQLARALYQDADIYLLDDPFSAVDATTATTLFTEYVMEALRGKAVLLVTHKVDFLPAFDNCLLMSRGEIIKNGPYHELLSSSDEFWALVNAHNETAGAERLEQITKHKMHYNPSYTKEIVSEADVEKPFVGNDLLMHEEREVGDIGFKPYMQYLNQKNSYIHFFLAAISHLVFVGGQISQNSWMASNVDNPDVGKLKLVVVYLVIGLGSSISLFFRSISVVVLGMKSSKSLFSQLMSSLFHAPVSFYDSTPLGRILTRLSSDLSIVDLDLPFSLLFTVAATTTALANLGVLSIIAWQVLFVCIPVVYITIYLQGYYLTTAKELMRINATTKSFVANNLAESVAGAMTIRAFKQEERFFAEYLEIIDRNASPFFHSFAANDWLIERVGILGAIVFASTASCMVLLPHGTFGSGFIGMAIFYGLSLNTSLLFSIQNQSTLANLIISVERLNQYMNIPCEASEIMQKKPPENWPAVGVVEIQDLQIKYRPDVPLVLRGISCAIRGGDKVGIVGRTGSGKSTLIGALFRLVEPAGGKIIIDGIDIGVIGLEDLRSRLGIIPQDPVLFNGTVRYNLDPLSEHTNQELWEVLGKCQLRDAIGERELDSLVLEDGSNWSMGQRQLFCLGRALLRQSKVLVLDEATASIDNTSDMIIQATIRKEFAECTVIIVAHRIPTIMDCTKILGLHDGALVEYDEPMELLRRQDSLFCQLVKEYWSSIHLAEE